MSDPEVVVGIENRVRVVRADFADELLTPNRGGQLHAGLNSPLLPSISQLCVRVARSQWIAL